jgi:hypothetical protein
LILRTAPVDECNTQKDASNELPYAE